MPTPKKPGRDRLELVAEPEWIDLVAQAAAASERSVSGYVRAAVNAQMKKDGFEPGAAPAKPRGRPKKSP